MKACKISEISGDILEHAPTWFDDGATNKDIVFGLMLAACNTPRNGLGFISNRSPVENMR